MGDAVVSYLSGKSSQTLADTVGFDRNEQLTLLYPPTADLLDKMVEAWDAARRNARVLLVLDTSGSMNLPADPSAVTGPTANKSRLDLLKPAVKAGIDLLSQNDQLGLWTFSSGSPNSAP